MRAIIILFTLMSCGLTETSLLKRRNETKIRDKISSKRSALKTCARTYIPGNQIKLDLLIRVGLNKQVSFFSVNNGKASKRLTDCFFKTLDLMYFDNISIKSPVSINYQLYLK